MKNSQRDGTLWVKERYVQVIQFELNQNNINKEEIWKVILMMECVKQWIRKQLTKQYTIEA